jgi:lysosomal acid lipase/cholesteryl ester hydrolase
LAINKIKLSLFQDVLKLTTALPNLVSNYLVPFAEWNHLDYLWAIDADTLLYPEVLKNMDKYRYNKV